VRPLLTDFLAEIVNRLVAMLPGGRAKNEQWWLWQAYVYERTHWGSPYLLAACRSLSLCYVHICIHIKTYIIVSIEIFHTTIRQDKS
jgi:hypothetical protein